MTEGRKETYDIFLRNITPFQRNIIPIRGLSTEVVSKVSTLTNHLDLLFIDGDHSYEGVYADWQTYKVFLKEGAIVAFHDYGWADGVKRVVKENVVPYVSVYNNLPNLWWGVIGKASLPD